MKIELNENKVCFNNGSEKNTPFLVRKIGGEDFLDKGTTKTFDPTTLNSEISINKANINDKFLELILMTVLHNR